MTIAKIYELLKKTDMEEAIVFNQKQKKESLRKALIGAGYDMATSQTESMEEDLDSWHDYIIDNKINPKCIDISDQAGHSFYNNEMDMWFELDEIIFPEGCGKWGINNFLEKNEISDDEVFGLIYEGAIKYINDNYGKNWKEKYPEPKFK